MREAAEFLKKPYTTYVNHEKEYREPNSEDLVSYAKAYKVSIDYLIGRSNEKTATIGDGYSEKQKLVNEMFDQCSPEDQDLVIDFLKRLSQNQ